MAIPYLVARSFAFVAERLSSQSRHLQEICCEKRGENRTSFFWSCNSLINRWIVYIRSFTLKIFLRKIWSIQKHVLPLQTGWRKEASFPSEAAIECTAFFLKREHIAREVIWKVMLVSKNIFQDFLEKFGGMKNKLYLCNPQGDTTRCFDKNFSALIW